MLDPATLANDSNHEILCRDKKKSLKENFTTGYGVSISVAGAAEGRGPATGMSGEIGLLEHIQMIRGRLKPTLQAVADTVLSRPSQVSGMNIRDLAAACDVSEARSAGLYARVGLAELQGVPDPQAEERGAAEEEVCHAPQSSIYENHRAW